MARKKKEPKPPTYQFDVGDKLLYLGAYDVYADQECEVLARSKVRKVHEWYRVRFGDGEDILTSVKTLRRKEEEINNDF